MTMKIIDTTDGKFIGVNVEIADVIELGEFVFVPDQVKVLPNGVTRLSNSSYVIDLVEDKDGKNYFAQWALSRAKPAH